jgi:hypothetical protein
MHKRYMTELFSTCHTSIYRVLQAVELYPWVSLQGSFQQGRKAQSHPSHAVVSLCTDSSLA